MTEPVQMMLPFDCKECFMRGCECKCHTCRVSHERNAHMTNLELTRLSVQRSLDEMSPEDSKRIGRMLKGMGL
jgi:hypothetical protein